MAESTTREAVFAVIKENILGILDNVDEGAIAEGAALKELGANSLDRAEIVTGSMEDLGLAFPMRELAGIGNIGELVALLHAKANG